MLLTVPDWISSGLLACFAPLLVAGGATVLLAGTAVLTCSSAPLAALDLSSAYVDTGCTAFFSRTTRPGWLVPRRFAWASRRATEAVLPWPPPSNLRDSGRLHLGVPFPLVVSSILMICLLRWFIAYTTMYTDNQRFKNRNKRRRYTIPMYRKVKAHIVARIYTETVRKVRIPKRPQCTDIGPIESGL